ncbi:ion transporter [Halodesulfovibrio marinisediminis]|uniref:Voltage-gated potassium channel n=1 Tax=Halodesulfovibrio marinisediminis DSM 17456 TaxID=1121457 RepID=A0A1N6FR27_9BACT|nr:ion transporter [Halodesulfovibrio marinisediminis]SIN97720.1 voltage-gated potassium channel [Halodesulfovibrio marinisediminis DSM 17456]
MKRRTLKHIVYDTMYLQDTLAGKVFNFVLIACILMSVGVVLAYSIPSFAAEYWYAVNYLEFFFTVLFTIEYALRVWCTPSPKAYIMSGYGVIDFLSIAPTWITILFPFFPSLALLRLFRVLRILRLVKLLQYLNDMHLIVQILRNSRRRIAVLTLWIMVLVVIFGTLMYVIEGQEHGFTSIPISIYWAIVTLTTVGYGDIVPQTVLGKAVAALIMLIGYSMIVILAGVISQEFSDMKKNIQTLSCNSCGKSDHEHNAVYCKHCGNRL